MLFPQAVKIEVVKEFRQPMTKTDVRAFLGLVGYYRQFINNISLLAVPLSDLIKKDRPDQVAWTDECEISFQALKDSLCSDSILRPPCYDRPFCLQTDACGRGIGYHFTTLPLPHPTTSPPYHFTTLSLHHPTTSPPYHFTPYTSLSTTSPPTTSPHTTSSPTTSPSYHFTTLSIHHPINSPPYHFSSTDSEGRRPD